MPPLKLLPLIDDIVEVLKYDFANLPLISWRHFESKRLLNIEVFHVQPELAFHIPVSAMDMYGLVAFIRVEKKPPAKKHKNGWH
jgi:hypothetical protein